MRPFTSHIVARCALLLAMSCASAAAAQSSPPPAPTGDLRGDLKIFERQVVEADVSYTPAARAEARARLHALEAKVDRLDRLEVEVELCRIAALANNAHTGCVHDLPAPEVDVGFYPLQGESYVFRATGAEADLVGGRLLSIDGRPIEAVRGAVRSLLGGRPGWRDLSAFAYYSRPAILKALGVADSAEAAVYRIQTPDGRVVQRRLVAPAKPGPITPILAAARTPWVWRDMADPFRWRDAPEHGALIIQLRSNVDRPGRPVAAFLDEVERQRAALGRKTVIIDLRSNTGGDMTLTREAFAAWPSRVGPGARFLMLLGPRTLSAALANAAYLKQAGGPAVTIVGESPGDGMMFFAETAPVTLPGTGLFVQIALERDDLKDGCRPYRDCHAGLAQPGGPTATPPERQAFFKRMPVSVATLEPDVPAPVTIADYLAGQDAGLARALELAKPCADAACGAESHELAGPL